MKLNRLVGTILLGICRQHQLRDQEYISKKTVIKQALINTIILKNTNTVTINPDVSITLKFQRVNKAIEQDDMIYVCVEYGYQNIRIYNINLKETITLAELTELLKQK